MLEVLYRTVKNAVDETKPIIGRPREFDPERALADITTVFWERGFDGASMSELVAACGVQKASLYGAFGDKRSVYLRALEEYIEQLLESAAGALGPGHAHDRFSRMFRNAVTRAATGDRRGCFLCCAASDQADLDAEIGDVVRIGLKRLEGVFEVALRETFPRKPERVAAARRLLGVYVSLQSLARAGYPSASLQSITKDAVATIPVAVA